jgi:uncharacterized membrane protein
MRDNAHDDSEYSRLERRGSCLAHGAALFVGLPLFIFVLPLSFAFLPSPIMAYLISRAFRRRQLSWGASQAMQATVIHFLIVVLAALLVVPELPGKIALTFGTMGFLLFLYSLWAAFDTLLGDDFRYVGIGSLADRVSSVNLARKERSRRKAGD